MTKNLQSNSRFLAFFLLITVMMFSATGLQASCNTPTTIVTAKAGNWNTGSTWVGGVVPEICDFVIVKHNVNLDRGIDIGQNGNGGLTINAGVTLSGSSNITINPGYYVVNNGIVSVPGFSIQGGTPGGQLQNNGTFTVSSSVAINSNAMITNTGTLNLSVSSIDMNGATIVNTSTGKVTMTGKISMNGSPDAIIDNSGTFTLNSSDVQALKLQNGKIYNRLTGILNLPNGGIYLSSSNTVINENRINAKIVETHDGATFNNYDSLIIATDLINGGNFINFEGGYVEVGRDFTQLNKGNSVYTNEGYTKIVRNFTNNKLVNGCGVLTVGGVSTNNSGATISGCLSLCDFSKVNSANVVDNNFGTIGASVRNCGASVPCASIKPNTINGSRNPQANTSATYSISSFSGASYNWTVPTGWTITAGQGTTTITVSVPNNTTAGRVRVTLTASCGTNSACIPVQPVNATPSTPGTIVKPIISGCNANDGYTFSVPCDLNATYYTWTFPNGWTVLSGATTNSITVRPGATSGTVSVIACNASGCSGARTTTVNGIGAPATPGAITGTAAECLSTSFAYSISAVSGATSYTWTAPSGWSITSGQGTISISGTVGASAGNVTVTATNTCGTSSASQLAVTVTSSVPSNPSISGNQTPCSGSSINYTATSTGATSFTWTVPTAYTLSSGQGTNSANVVIPTSNGTIQVRSSNACGLSVSTTTRNITPIATPAAVDSITGARYGNFLDAKDYSVNNVANTTSYVWTVPTSWSINNGQGSTAINANLGIDSGLVTVTPMNGVCAGPTTQKFVNVNPNPTPLPVLLTSFAGSVSNNSVKLNWATATEINNDKFEVERSINGANWTKVGEVKGNGNTMSMSNYNFSDKSVATLNVKTVYYRLRQIDFDGKFEFSPIVKMNIVPNAADDKVWYNNLTGSISANIEGLSDGNATITVITLDGKTIMTENVSLNTGSNSITLPANIPTGMYNVIINNDNNIRSFKVIRN